MVEGCYYIQFDVIFLVDETRKITNGTIQRNDSDFSVLKLTCFNDYKWMCTIYILIGPLHPFQKINLERIS